MESQFFATILESVQNLYSVFDSLNLSVTGLLVLGLVLALGFLFAIREAAAWFFKVDDLKRDVRRMQELVLAIEGEVRTLQNIVVQGREAKRETQMNSLVDEMATISPMPLQAAPTVETKKPESAKPFSGFTVNH